MVAELLVLVGALLTLLAGVGVVRFDDVFARLHALSKATTLGFLLVLIGAAIALSDPNDITSLVLAAETGGTVYAVDVVLQYLEQLQHSATAQGLGDRIITLDVDFTHPEKLPRDIDLLWSEGAIYFMGFEAGLRAWRPLLVPGAAVAITELVWLTDAPSAEAKAFWAEGYPAMTDVATKVRAAEAAGYQVVDTFVLPSGSRVVPPTRVTPGSASTRASKSS